MTTTCAVTISGSSKRVGSRYFELLIVILSFPSLNSFGSVVQTFFFFFLYVYPGKLSEMKSTWSPGPISHSQASLSHDMWKVPQGPRSSSAAPTRPPPGLTNTKPSSTWGGNSLGLSQGWSSSYTTGMSHLMVNIYKKMFLIKIHQI